MPKKRMPPSISARHRSMGPRRPCRRHRADHCKAHIREIGAQPSGGSKGLSEPLLPDKPTYGADDNVTRSRADFLADGADLLLGNRCLGEPVEVDSVPEQVQLRPG